MPDKPRWLLDIEQRAKENERAAQEDPSIRAHLRDVENRTERLKQMQAELNKARAASTNYDEDNAPPPKVAPKVTPLRSRFASHGGRRERSAACYRPHTLEECRDEALTHDYEWRGIERTAPARIAREYA